MTLKVMICDSANEGTKKQLEHLKQPDQMTIVINPDDLQIFLH